MTRPRPAPIGLAPGTSTITGLLLGALAPQMALACHCPSSGNTSGTGASIHGTSPWRQVGPSRSSVPWRGSPARAGLSCTGRPGGWRRRRAAGRTAARPHPAEQHPPQDDTRRDRSCQPAERRPFPLPDPRRDSYPGTPRVARNSEWGQHSPCSLAGLRNSRPTTSPQPCGRLPVAECPGSSGRHGAGADQMQQ